MMADTFLFRYEGERGLLRSLLIDNRTALHENAQSQAAKPITIDDVPLVLHSGEGMIDFLSFATNPNMDWWADVTYHFTYAGDQATDTASTILYPGDHRPLPVVAVASQGVASAKLVIDNVAWHRIDTHAIPDPASWLTDRLSFSVTDAVYESLALGKETIGHSTFTITNNTAYGYWSVPLVVMLKRGSSVIGVSTTSIDTFTAGHAQTVDMNWFVTLPSVTSIDVVPLVNVFDPASYLAPEGVGGVDSRVEQGQ